MRMVYGKNSRSFGCTLTEILPIRQSIYMQKKGSIFVFRLKVISLNSTFEVCSYE